MADQDRDIGRLQGALEALNTELKRLNGNIEKLDQDIRHIHKDHGGRLRALEAFKAKAVGAISLASAAFTGILYWIKTGGNG